MMIAAELSLQISQAGSKGKSTKQVTSKKRKYPDVETARAAAVAEAVERAERGGARSRVVIAD